ncbi:DEAD/DEAH box helicase, partial [Pseudomonas aeruginosa]
KVLALGAGVPFGPQVAWLEQGVYVVVGTPGRIQEHLRKGTLVLGGLNTLVLAEADRMLDMGFYDSIAEIIGQLPERRQTLLFSATYPDGIEKLAKTFMRDPRQVKVESLHADSQIEQRFFEIDPKQRMDAVVRPVSYTHLPAGNHTETPKKEVLLVKQYSKPVEKPLLEIPAA